MSIIKNVTRITPVAKIRSFFMHIIIIVSFFSMFSLTCMAGSVVSTQDIFHNHTGNANGGGCYTVRKTGTKEEQVSCGGSMVYFPAQNESKCSNCAASYTGDQSHRSCWHSKTVYTDYTYYERGCNMSDSVPVGKLTLEKSTDNWSKSIQLIASYQVPATMSISSTPFVWNGGQPTNQNVYTVTQNGNYTLALAPNENATAETATVSVKNIDTTAPVIYSHMEEPGSGWSAKSVVVTISKTEDKQPDGSNGSGLHEKPYSYDKGKTWTAQNKYEYTGNGTYTIMVRDKVGNSSAYNVTIANIDKTAPVIYSHMEEPRNGWSVESVVVTIDKTEDKQPDGSNGSGLHEKPYSYDKGKTWTAQNKYEYIGNGTYPIMVRDKVGNTSSYNVVIRNVDNTAPALSGYIVEPAEEWTKENVKVVLKDASDKQPDGSDGCGLHETPYSYDNGQTWTAETEYTYTENGAYVILVRDMLENTSSYEITITNIDKSIPQIEAIEYDDTVNAKEVTITVTASDKQPDGSAGCGLPESPYSFDGGNSWISEPIWTVDRNETIVIAVRDQLDNIVYEEIVISNIDCFPPAISYEMVEASWTNKDVQLFLQVYDENEDGSKGIGPADEWYSLDGGITWTNEAVRTYDKNQEIAVLARDRNNNQAVVEIAVTQIDKDLPWVNLEKEVVGSGDEMKVRIIATAGDDGSGLHEEAYSWDEGKTFVEGSTVLVPQNGSYQVIVRDKAGNQKIEKIDVSEFPVRILDLLVKKEPIVEEADEKDDDKPENDEPKKDNVQKKEEQPVIVEADTKKTIKGKAVDKGIIPEEPNSEEIETEEETVVQEIRKEEPVRQKVRTQEKNSLDWIKLLKILCVIIGGLILVLLFCVLWLRTVAVYVEGEQERMKYMGRRWTYHRGEHYEVHLSESLLEQCNTTHFSLRPCWLFVKLHQGKEICCLFPEDICIIKEVEKRIDISLL